MITALSGERPIVSPSPNEYSFNRRPSYFSVSFDILSSSCRSHPPAREAAPQATRHFHHHHGDVVGATMAIGGGYQGVADPLRLPQFVQSSGHHELGHHARQP